MADDGADAASPGLDGGPSSGRGILALALAMLLSSLGVSIANVALPALAQAFDATLPDVQWIVLAYLLALTTVIVSAGRLGDVLGHRRVLLAGIAVFTFASGLCGAATDLWMLIGARVLQGAGGAVLMALTVALVRETVAAKRTGSAMGLLGSMSAIGTALGPSLGGLLLSGPGWRAVFFVMVPIGALTLLIASRGLPRREQRPGVQREGFDVPGMLLLGLTLAAYASAVTAGDGSFGPLNGALLAAALLGVALFVRAEAKAASPLMRPSAFRDVGLSAGLGMNALVSAVMMATLVVGPFYLSRGLGLDIGWVGIVLSVGPLISALSGLPAGRAVDRLGAPSVVVLGLVAMAAGSLALSMIPGTTGVVGYIAAIALLTPGYQLFQAANNTSVMMGTRPEDRGAVSGLLSLFRNLGLITGASAMGALFAYASGRSDIVTAGAAAVGRGMTITFGVAAALMLVALGLAIGVRGRSRQAEACEPRGRGNDPAAGTGRGDG